MEIIVLIIISIGLFSAGMFLVFQDKYKYIKEIKKETAKIETGEYKNSQEYQENQKKIEEAGIIEVSVNNLFGIREESMKRLNAPNTLFLHEKIHDTETDYLLKFAMAHGCDNSENIDTINEKISSLMGYSLDD
ncbi:hypothetical protein FCU45_00500 [Sulfurimonas crateris]|uniref:Uncharacterized protein n=1 Tax=Sulfurimonas crateris TaxID=2574727 RepID=A0A4U2ZA80_9BACT|nr:hypothetical protein [Sulfurimonas crateris]TKI70905.1 hypothetical protein FCU45_00500 [Sulfurimonas crateris]